MKSLIFISIMLLSGKVFADENSCVTTTVETVEGTKEIDTKVPKNLEGATIYVKTKDGKMTEVPAEQFKVVPRKQQFIVNKVKQTDRINCPPGQMPVVRKNRISLLAGQGYNRGINASSSGSAVEAESKVGIIGGVMYQRLLNARWSLGGQVIGSDLRMRDKQILGVLGYDF